MLRWRFEKAGEETWPTATGTLIVNDADFAVRAALDGVGIVYVNEDRITALVEQGRLVTLLADWSPRLSGIFIYYSSRHQMPPPLKAFVEFARARIKNATRPELVGTRPVRRAHAPASEFPGRSASRKEAPSRRDLLPVSQGVA
jgi:DNA-binding transcriptional LysR family regulator